MNMVSGSHLHASVSVLLPWCNQVQQAATHFGTWSNADTVKAMPPAVRNHSVPRMAHPTPLLYRNTNTIGVKVPVPKADALVRQRGRVMCSAGSHACNQRVNRAIVGDAEAALHRGRPLKPMVQRGAHKQVYEGEAVDRKAYNLPRLGLRALSGGSEHSEGGRRSTAAAWLSRQVSAGRRRAAPRGTTREHECARPRHGAQERQRALAARANPPRHAGRGARRLPVQTPSR